MPEAMDDASLPSDDSGIWVNLTVDIAVLIEDLDVDKVEVVYLRCLSRWDANQLRPSVE